MQRRPAAVPSNAPGIDRLKLLVEEIKKLAALVIIPVKVEVQPRYREKVLHRHVPFVANCDVVRRFVVEICHSGARRRSREQRRRNSGN